MRSMFLKLGALLCVAVLATGCATSPKSYDYTAFKQSRPRSILVLPPVNNSPDVEAPYSLYAQVTLPLAESGYYVFPVTLVDETFKQNGLSVPADIHAVPIKKLREIFGADSALYITVSQYGSSYTVLNSVVRVTAQAKLVDLKTGTLLWQGAATASNDENQNNSGGIIGMLVTAVVKQVLNNVTDESYRVAGTTSIRLLAARPNGLLYGPRSPRYEQEQQP